MVKIPVYNKTDRYFDVAMAKEWLADSDAWTYISAHSYDVWKRNKETFLWVRDDEFEHKYQLTCIDYYGNCHINLHGANPGSIYVEGMNIHHLETNVR